MNVHICIWGIIGPLKLAQLFLYMQCTHICCTPCNSAHTRWSVYRGKLTSTTSRKTWEPEIILPCSRQANLAQGSITFYCTDLNSQHKNKSCKNFPIQLPPYYASVFRTSNTLSNTNPQPHPTLEEATVKKKEPLFQWFVFHNFNLASLKANSGQPPTSNDLETRLEAVEWVQ